MQCPAVLVRRHCFCLCLAGLLGLVSPAPGMIGTIDAVPAATLLVPYFEVDVANSSGVNTLFTINNASDLAVLTHVTVWTDQSIPALDFDVYLTGYDVELVNMRDIFVAGNLPRTASVGQDPADTISPKGSSSQDINFSSCSVLPYAPGAVSGSFRAHLKAWFQGNPSPATGNCAGSKQPDTDILRGYVTVDTVNACNLFFPSDWAFYEPFVTDQNVLWGDVIYVDASPSEIELGFGPGPRQKLDYGDTLVHIESCPSCFSPGDHTFYGRYSGGTAADAREPLPTTMAARFLTATNNNDFFIWREGNESDSAYSCTLQGPPSWYPLSCTQIVLFDTQEQPAETDCDFPIPNEANSVDLTADLLAPFGAGWAYLNLQHPIATYEDPYAQMWLSTRMEVTGLYAVGFSGIQLDNANAPITNIIP
jgi:hypothetical protein